MMSNGSVSSNKRKAADELTSSSAQKRTRPGDSALESGGSDNSGGVSGGGSLCPICYEPWSDSDADGHRLVSLKCGHFFGDKCVRKWVKDKRECPICRIKTTTVPFLNMAPK